MSCKPFRISEAPEAVETPEDPVTLEAPETPEAAESSAEAYKRRAGAGGSCKGHFDGAKSDDGGRGPSLSAEDEYGQWNQFYRDGTDDPRYAGFVTCLKL